MLADVGEVLLAAPRVDDDVELGVAYLGDDCVAGWVVVGKKRHTSGRQEPRGRAIDRAGEKAAMIHRCRAATPDADSGPPTPPHTCVVNHAALLVCEHRERAGAVGQPRHVAHNKPLEEGDRILALQTHTGTGMRTCSHHTTQLSARNGNAFGDEPP